MKTRDPIGQHLLILNLKRQVRAAYWTGAFSSGVFIFAALTTYLWAIQ